MIKILLNQTTSNIDLDIGVTVPASGQVTLTPQDYDEAATSDDLVTEIGNGNIIVNDGNQDLTKADGIRLIQGGFSNKIQLDDDLLNLDRVKVDVTGTLSDGLVKVSSNDSSSGTLIAKVTSFDNKLSVDETNDGSFEQLELRVNAQNIDTADLTNNAGFITSGQAPVQPVDIANFETTLQLNDRDVDNRDRSNHTGTQLAATISDLSAAIQANETVTSLTFNTSTNVLTYVNEAGTSQNVDLTQFLDDTNLARIVNGTLNSTTGVVTFTRDDSTTFTIDMSSLLDNQNADEVPFVPTGNTTSNNVQDAIIEIQSEVDLNTLKVSADDSIDTHSDVDVTTNTPVLDDVLQWDGNNFVPSSVSTSNGFTIFPVWAEESGGLTSNSRQWSFGNGATGNINIVLPIDAEMFAVSFDAESGSGSTTMLIQQDDSTVFTTKDFAFKDFESLPTPLQFTAGQCIGFRTGVETGAITDARICAWFRVRSSPAATSVINDLLDVSISSLSVNEALVWNGSNFTNQAVALTSSLSTVATTGDYGDLNNRPILGTAADNDESDFATAAQGTLATTAVQPSENVSILTNDSGYVNAVEAASAAPVQPVDIANFETTTELDSRDSDNRDRSNHTGTQLAATISDFTSEVQNSETVTNLTFNNTTKVLTFVNESGSVQNIDLTQFLDDTNLAQIVSGSLNSITGIATFTRDDSTTFTVDFSSLNDQSFINNAINNHEISINNHDDVNTAGASTGDLLVYNGSNWVPQRKRFKAFERRTDGIVNDTTTDFSYITLTVTIPETADYKINYGYTWSLDTQSNDFIGRVRVDDSFNIMEHTQEPKDSAGTGATFTNTTGGSTDTSTNQKHIVSGHDIINLTAGTHTITIDFRCEVASTQAAIYRGILSIEEWDY